MLVLVLGTYRGSRCATRSRPLGTEVAQYAAFASYIDDDVANPAIEIGTGGVPDPEFEVQARGDSTVGLAFAFAIAMRGRPIAPACRVHIPTQTPEAV